MQKAIITTSWDDGVFSDIKLSKLLIKYNIPSTFYISKNNKNKKNLSKKQIIDLSNNFDIGCHTLNHVYLPDIDLDIAKYEIVESKKLLEELIGKKISSFCYPRGGYNSDIINILKKAGFKGARTIKILEKNEFDSFKMGVTVHVCGGSYSHLRAILKHSKINALKNIKPIIYLLKNKAFSKNWIDVSKVYIKYVQRNGGIFHLWGHSWNIEDKNEWENLEMILKILSKLKKKENVVFMNNSELIKKFGVG